MANMDLHTQPPKATPLGTLGKLPIELRLDIFKQLFSEDFQQVFDITASGLDFNPKQSSPKPSCFDVSRQIRDEMTAARSNHRTATISLRTITTDFVANNKTSGLETNELTACKVLEVVIVRPSPRLATGYAQLRSNVHDFVDLLCSSKGILPKLAVKLEYTYQVDRGHCAYNDFAILFGPFQRLHTQRFRGIFLYRNTGSPVWSPQIERYCNLIEEAVTAASDTTILRYQQCMLEIKIPLTLAFCGNETMLTFSEMQELQKTSALRASQACYDLKLWCAQSAHAVPSWVEPFLAQITQKSCVPDVELRDEVLEANKVDLMCWLSGHHRAYNPFWDEDMGAAESVVFE